MQDVLFQLSSLKKVSMPYIRGYEEDGFMKQLDVSRQELEILAPDKVSTDDVLVVVTSHSLKPHWKVDETAPVILP
jgi:hypothetical protein